MSAKRTRVVLDTVIFVQALISDRGHSAGCLQRLRAGDFLALLSDETAAELRDVSVRPKLRTKYPHVSAETVAKFMADIETLTVRIPRPTSKFQLPRDPRDEPFIDLAIGGDADYIVTWNERHLTYLMKGDTPEGKLFCTMFPKIKIVTPAQFLIDLNEIANTSA